MTSSYSKILCSPRSMCIGSGLIGFNVSGLSFIDSSSVLHHDRITSFGSSGEPWAKDGRNTVDDCPSIPHSRATLTAVRGLSPVTILQPMLALRSVATAGREPGFSLFSNTMRPRNESPLSAFSRGKRCASTQLRPGSDLPAHAMTRKP